MGIIGKSVFSPRIARRLIQRGFQVIDIKPKKENPAQTIFIFEKTDELFKAINEFAYKF